MASDGPKSVMRGKSSLGAGIANPPAKRAAKAKLPAPMLPEPVEPNPVDLVMPPFAAPAPAAPIIPAAALPEIVAAPETAPPIAPEPPAPAAFEPAEPVATAPKPTTVNPQPTPPAPAVSSVANTQKDNTMEATMQEATDKSQAMFGDINGRAKLAMEKSARMFEDMNEFGKGNVEALVESSKIAAKGFESLGQGAAEYTRKQFEGATAMMKSFASVKSPTELFKMQGDFLRQSFDSMVAESSKNTEAMLKLVGEIAQPLSNRVAIAAEKAKMAA